MLPCASVLMWCAERDRTATGMRCQNPQARGFAATQTSAGHRLEQCTERIRRGEVEEAAEVGGSHGCARGRGAPGRSMPTAGLYGIRRRFWAAPSALRSVAWIRTNAGSAARALTLARLRHLNEHRLDVTWPEVAQPMMTDGRDAQLRYMLSVGLQSCRTEAVHLALVKPRPKVSRKGVPLIVRGRVFAHGVDELGERHFRN